MYIYPDNLAAKATLWLWELKDLAVIGIGLLLSVLALMKLRLMLPLVVAAQRRLKAQRRSLAAVARRLTPLLQVAAVPRKTMLPLPLVVAAQRRLKARRNLAAVARRQRKRNNYLRVKI